MLVRLASTQWVLYDGSSTWSGHDGVELVGSPVDVPLPADTPLAAVAADFDTHYQAGAAAP
jgi:hypothetical protein